MASKFSLIVSAALGIAFFTEAFLPSQRLQRCPHNQLVFDPPRLEKLALRAAAGEKKRRRRKQPPAVPGAPESTSASEPMASVEVEATDGDLLDDEEEVDIAMLKDIANFKFDGEIAASNIAKDTSRGSESITIPLPDIKDTIRKKELEEEMARMEEDEASSRVKIKRSDRKAMAKVRMVP